jgi:DNA-binding transcriptional LysR family regulator
MFLERCRRILSEVEAAELELCETHAVPRGRLRISLPLAKELVMATLTAFMRRYPAITLDVDFSDRLVDVIGEGFDVVVRTSELFDSRLMSRTLGDYRLLLVASPTYLQRRGTPATPAELQRHVCLQHRVPTAGVLERWPLRAVEGEMDWVVPTSMVCNTPAALLDIAVSGLGIACLPDFMVRDVVERGELVEILGSHVEHHGTFTLLWPSSKFLSPKIRVFIDFIVENFSLTQADSHIY